MNTQYNWLTVLGETHTRFLSLCVSLSVTHTVRLGNCFPISGDSLIVIIMTNLLNERSVTTWARARLLLCFCYCTFKTHSTCPSVCKWAPFWLVNVKGVTLISWGLMNYGSLFPPQNEKNKQKKKQVILTFYHTIQTCLLRISSLYLSCCCF